MRCVHGKYCSSLDVGSSLLPRYEDALVLLLTEVLNRIQFRYNQAQLEELDDETLDDDVRGISLLLIYLTSLLLKKKKCFTGILHLQTRNTERPSVHGECFEEY